MSTVDEKTKLTQKDNMGNEIEYSIVIPNDYVIQNSLFDRLPIKKEDVETLKNKIRLIYHESQKHSENQ